jgi:hypothetical protein
MSSEGLNGFEHVAFIRQGPIMKIGSRLYKRNVSQDGHVKNGQGED